MARVTAPTSTYKVVFTEYDRFSGQKHWDTEYYDNEQEARQRVIDYNTKHNNLDFVPEWYVRAEYVGCVA